MCGSHCVYSCYCSYTFAQKKKQLKHNNATDGELQEGVSPKVINVALCFYNCCLMGCISKHVFMEHKSMEKNPRCHQSGLLCL